MADIRAEAATGFHQNNLPLPALMKIQLVFFHGQLGDLWGMATAEFGLVICEEQVAGQLPGFHRLPGTAAFTAGLVPAPGQPQLSHKLYKNQEHIDKVNGFCYKEARRKLPGTLSPLFSLPYFLPFRGGCPYSSGISER
jgi:hypothetical protein